MRDKLEWSDVLNTGSGVGKTEPVFRKYNELIMAVARKFPNETRHETALRYILQAENQCNGPCEVGNERGNSVDV